MSTTRNNFKNYTVTYNNNDRITTIGSNTYTYDLNNIRRTKSNGIDTTTFYYDNEGLLIKEERSNYPHIIYHYNGSDIIGFSLKTSVNSDYTNYLYSKNIQNDIIRIYKLSDKSLVAEYDYDAFGNQTIITNIDNIASINPFRYRSYYYDTETNLYYLKSRYYSPELMRFITPDRVSILDDTMDNIDACNLYVYCANNPVMYADENGYMPTWAKWAIGVAIIVAAAALTVITAGGFAAAGTAIASVFTATMAPTAMSAIFAGAFVGSLTIGTAGMAIGGLSGQDGWSWDNASNGFIGGTILGAIIGGAWGGTHYALQSAGKMAIKVSISNITNNPADDFVKVGPKDGAISEYIKTISETGNYGKISVSKLSNGMYQIANGHHRTEALRRLGYEVIKIYLTK